MAVLATHPASPRPAPRVADADLIRRCVAGDAAAARALHAHYHPVAAAFLRKLGARPEEVEDAAQEVFLQFFRYLARFRGDAELKTWLYRLCVTEARRVRRRRKVGARVSAFLLREAPGEAAPSSAYNEAAAARLVACALDRMSEPHRLVFVLFEMEGLPGRQVAEIAGCPEATLWRRLHDARRVFREALGIDTPAKETIT
jgi:RNA polymerase sigma-70 factor (ECF subfamily)